jgi:hypothetical protein
MPIDVDRGNMIPPPQRLSLNKYYNTMQADEKVLVYHYRATGTPVVDKAMAVITHKELEDILTERTSHFSCTEPIDRFLTDSNTQIPNSR